jgi:hypothetical protein
LIITLMAMSLMLALALALILTTMAETRIAGHNREQAEALYAADAALERVVPELFAHPNWDALLSGAARSSFADGAPGGPHALPGGQSFDLAEASNSLRCNKATCDAADLLAVTEERPWGRNNPIWQPFAYGPLDRLLPERAIESRMYVVVWIADDPFENDDDPLRDGGVPVGCDPSNDPSCVDRNAGKGVVALMARAIGPGGTQRTVSATIARIDRPRVLSWREVR